MRREAPEQTASTPASPLDPPPVLVKHVVEALALGADDLLVDLRCGDCKLVEQILQHVSLTWQILAVEAAEKYVVEGSLSPDIRPVAMDAASFLRFPIRYHKAVLLDGFRALQTDEGALERIFHQIIPGGRLLIIETVPTAELPLPAAELERWQAERADAEEIARLLAEAGFTTQKRTVECECRALAAQCLSWLEERAWPILEGRRDQEMARGVDELRRRYADEREVSWTARHELVTGFKKKDLPA